MPSNAPEMGSNAIILSPQCPVKIPDGARIAGVVRHTTASQYPLCREIRETLDQLQRLVLIEHHRHYRVRIVNGGDYRLSFLRCHRYLPNPRRIFDSGAAWIKLTVS